MEDLQEAGASLESLVYSFNTRISELQELVITRNMYPATSMVDQTFVNATLKAMESQIWTIKERLQEERAAIPKAKKILELSLHQQWELQHMLSHIPSAAVRETTALHYDQNPSSSSLDAPDYHEAFALKEEPAVLSKIRKSLDHCVWQ